MKHLKYWFMLMLTVLTFAACEEKEDENKEPKWTDYFSMQVTRCERVGDNLKVDFTLKNITKKDLQGVALNGQSVWDRSKDDLGNDYYSKVSVSGGNWMGCPEFNLAKGESISGSFLITNYDKTNSSKKFNLIFNGRCKTVDFDGRAEIGGIKVVDNRILKNGFDTNDQILTYKAISCKMVQEEDGLSHIMYNYVYLTYQVTNKSSIDISQFKQNIQDMDSKVIDNTSESYNANIAIADGNFGSSQTTTLRAGETKSFTIKANHVRDNAKTLSGIIVSSDNSYPWADTKVHFYDIPITK